MRPQSLNVINKEIKPFEKEFYNSFKLTNLPQGDLQLNGGWNCPRGNWHRGLLSGGVIVWGVIVRGVIGTGGNCPGGDCLGGNWHGGNCQGELSWGLLVRE